MARTNYTEFEGGFNQVVLEESFVMNLKTTMSFVDFKINFAVNPNYPLYVAPEAPAPSVSSQSDEDSEYSDYWEDDDEDEHGAHESGGHEPVTDAPPSSMSDESPSLEATSVAVAQQQGDKGDSQESNRADEQTTLYPYRMGRIFFPNMEQVRWVSRIQPYIDPSSGSVDYGAIDYFYRDDDDGRYYLAGYWGELELLSGPPILEIDELKQHTMQQQQQEKSKPTPS